MREEVPREKTNDEKERGGIGGADSVEGDEATDSDFPAGSVF